MPKRDNGSTLVAATTDAAVYAGLPVDGTPVYLDDAIAKSYVDAGVAKYVEDTKTIVESIKPVVDKEIK